MADLSEFLPLLCTAARVAFIDDDPHYVESLQFAMPKAVRGTFHRSPLTLNPELARSRVALERERAAFVEIASGVQDEIDGVPRRALAYFANRERLDTTVVLVSDFAMPMEDGVSLCARHAIPGLQRVLLTGIADTDVAVKAFNARHIEAYLPKHTGQLLQRVGEEVDALFKASGAQRGFVLDAALSPSFKAALTRPEVRRAVLDLLAGLEAAEYMVLGEPQGILGVRADGRAVWVQIEDESSCASTVEILADSKWPQESLERVRQRESVVDVDWSRALNRQATEQPCRVLSAWPFLGAAVFELVDLPAELTPAASGR